MKTHYNLCSLLILLVVFSLPINILAQSTKGVSVSLGTVRTTSEEIAMRYAVEYTKDIKDIFLSAEVDSSDSWLFALSPSLQVEVGGNDAFDGTMLKLTGFLISFDVISSAGITIPNTGKLCHTFPISLVAETDRSISNVAGLVEIGYFPWYKNVKSISEFFRQIKLGLFFQAGYKLKSDPRSSSAQNGSVNESRESEESFLSRIKGSVGLKLYEMSVLGIVVSLSGNGDIWMDILNDDFYYKADISLGGRLSANYNIDLRYQKGSGAPLFNFGDQVSANLSMQY